MILYNNKPVEFGQFPNGEVNLKFEIDKEFFRSKYSHVVTLKYEDDSDLFHLLLVREALSKGGPLVHPVLRIMYVPYSRMDRDNGIYEFSLKTFCKFINDMNWRKVIVYEPHSDVTPALLDRCEVHNVTEKLLKVIKFEYQLFYPDAGAQKRYGHLGEGLLGFKKRDFETGKITEYEVIGERTHDTVVIVDDLCSKGGTFILAAKKLREMGFKTIVLVVAHMEDTYYEGDLLTTDLIDHLIFTDSIENNTPEGTMVYHHGTLGKLITTQLTCIPIVDTTKFTPAFRE